MWNKCLKKRQLPHFGTHTPLVLALFFDLVIRNTRCADISFEVFLLPALAFHLSFSKSFRKWFYFNFFNWMSLFRGAFHFSTKKMQLFSNATTKQPRFKILFVLLIFTLLLFIFIIPFSLNSVRITERPKNCEKIWGFCAHQDFQLLKALKRHDAVGVSEAACQEDIKKSASGNVFWVVQGQHSHNDNKLSKVTLSLSRSFRFISPKSQRSLRKQSIIFRAVLCEAPLKMVSRDG